MFIQYYLKFNLFNYPLQRITASKYVTLFLSVIKFRVSTRHVICLQLNSGPFGIILVTKVSNYKEKKINIKPSKIILLSKFILNNCGSPECIFEAESDECNFSCNSKKLREVCNLNLLRFGY